MADRWPAGVAVVMVTVAGREAPRSVTVADWRAVGAEPVVSVQPDAWPVCHASHRRHVDRVLTGALRDRPGAEWLLLTEDDVDVDPAAAGVVADITAGATEVQAVTLWASGVRRYPPEVRDLIEQGRPFPHRWLCPVRGLATWHGSLAVLLRRGAAEALVSWRSDGEGWDIHLREWLRREGLPLYVTVPNLVQHRGVPSLASKGGWAGAPRSATWRWPVAAG